MPTGVYIRTVDGEQRRIAALQARFISDPSLGQRVAGYLTANPEAMKAIVYLEASRVS